MSDRPQLAGVVRSVQVGAVGTVPHRGRAMRTAIDKRPVAGRVAIGIEGLDGDQQADRKRHGGPELAVCCYPSEHLPRWAQLLGHDLPPGAFGENLTLAGLTEEHVHVGDVFTVGTAVVQVSEPRTPCVKLAARWRKRTLVRLMAEDRQAGWYLRVLQSGDVGAGDTMTLTARTGAVTVAQALADMLGRG